MKAFAGAVFALALPFGAQTGLGATAVAGETIAVQDMTLTVPEGWTLRQDAKDAGTIILGFQNGAEYLTLYVKRQTGLDMRALFANGSQVVRDVRPVPRNSYNWKVLETSKRFAAQNTTHYVASFLAEAQGFSYYGFSRSASSATAMENVTQFMQELR